jgi:hypothetical protein
MSDLGSSAQGHHYFDQFRVLQKDLVGTRHLPALFHGKLIGSFLVGGHLLKGKFAVSTKCSEGWFD